MKSFIAYAFFWAVAFLGMCLGLGFCAGVGYFIGLPFHAPTAGVLCGFAWYGYGWFHTADGIAERTNARARQLARSM